MWHGDQEREGSGKTEGWLAEGWLAAGTGLALAPGNGINRAISLPAAWPAAMYGNEQTAANPGAMMILSAPQQRRHKPRGQAQPQTTPTCHATPRSFKPYPARSTRRDRTPRASPAVVHLPPGRRRRPLRATGEST